MKFPKAIIVCRGLLKRNGKVLLLHRTGDQGYNPDKWELPGGKIEFGEDLNAAIEKEVLEETGLLVKITSPSAFVEAKTNVIGKYKGIFYLEIVSRVKIISGTIRISPEHSEYRWINHHHVFDYDLSLEAKKALTFFITKSTRV